MSNIAYTYTFVDGTAADADEVNQNFQDVIAAVNNGALNSDNYGVASIGSTHLASGAVTTAKIGAAAVTSSELGASAVTTAKIDDLAVATAKINDAAVVEAKADYSQANSGLLVLRGGPNYATSGRRYAMAVKSVTLPASASVVTVTATLSTDCQDGDPAFSATPILAGWSFEYLDATPASADCPDKVWVSAISSTAITLELLFDAVPPSAGGTASLNLFLVGAV